MIATATSFYCIVPSPIGNLLLTSNGEALTGLHMDPDGGFVIDPDWDEDRSILAPAIEQLADYFAGERRTFNLKMELEGTAFQKQVWEELQRIPYGQTISYQELARRVGNPNASRAVGSANGKNPVAVIVPCHRVIATGGTLGGYGGGLARKEWLLNLETQNRSQR
ncbi:MAG TPA: methylated-DNA--[protein]-cysteine S-methyltransferase [Fimbriiglobus sp.]|jgi:methylated-DNA-[protein]-cysteine S-methyltransferase